MNLNIYIFSSFAQLKNKKKSISREVVSAGQGFSRKQSAALYAPTITIMHGFFSMQ